MDITGHVKAGAIFPQQTTLPKFTRTQYVCWGHECQKWKQKNISTFESKKPFLVLELTLKNTYCVKRAKELANESFILIYAEIRKQKHPYHTKTCRKPLPRITKRNRAALCTISNHRRKHSDETIGKKYTFVCNLTE